MHATTNNKCLGNHKPRTICYRLQVATQAYTLGELRNNNCCRSLHVRADVAIVFLLTSGVVGELRFSNLSEEFSGPKSIFKPVFYRFVVVVLGQISPMCFFLYKVFNSLASKIINN